MKVTREMDSDDGIEIGSVNSYVSKYKRNEEVKIDSVQRIVDEVVKKTIPEEWSEEAEKDILSYYYGKIAKLGDDLEVIAPKITSLINRVYNKEFSNKQIAAKLENLVIPDFKFTNTSSGSVKKIAEKFNISIKERSYDYIKSMPRLSREQLELTQFLEAEQLCFSSDDSGIFLTVKTGYENSFNDLFNFTSRENLIYEMFKEQLNDEFKAKKLVLMSRFLNEKPKKTKKDVLQK